MLYCRQFVLSFILVAGIAAEFPVISKRPMQPHEVAIALSNMNANRSAITSSRWKEIAHLFDILTPRVVLEQVHAQSSTISDVCASQTTYMLETLIRDDASGGWALDSKDFLTYMYIVNFHFLHRIPL